MVLLTLRPRTQVAICLIAVLAAAGSTTGCSADEDGTTPKPVDKVTYLTAFGLFGRESYVYVAKEKGFFAKRNIDVDVQAGSGASNNLKVLAAGGAQFSVNDLSGVMILQGAGKYRDEVRAVAAIHQQTLNSIMVLGQTGVRTPKDLEGKTLADTPGSVVRNLFPTYAKLANIDYTKVKWQDGQAAELIGTLATGKVDGIGQFVVGRPTIAAVTKKEPTFLPYSDYLTDLYGNVLITSSKNAKEKPEEVKKFAQALLKGLEYSLANPGEAATILKKSEPATVEAAAKAELELMASFVRSAGSGEKVGTIDTQRVARSIAILQGAGQLPQGITPEQIISVDLLPKV
jgi:NitT/TauT family transport system substrate-binding protein